MNVSNLGTSPKELCILGFVCPGKEFLCVYSNLDVVLFSIGCECNVSFNYKLKCLRDIVLVKDLFSLLKSDSLVPKCLFEGKGYLIGIFVLTESIFPLVIFF